MGAERILQLLQRIKQLNDLEAEDEPPSCLTPPEPNQKEIATLQPGFKRPLSPMLQVRFDYTASWENARLNQNWLSLSEISEAHASQTIQESLALRFENWGFVPPATRDKTDCAIFAHNPFEPDETYLVWNVSGDEPEVWEFFGGDYSVFHNLERYFEYIVGDRKVDDSGR
jgi:hypothetical protein